MVGLWESRLRNLPLAFPPHRGVACLFPTKLGKAQRAGRVNASVVSHSIDDESDGNLTHRSCASASRCRHSANGRASSRHSKGGLDRLFSEAMDNLGRLDTALLLDNFLLLLIDRVLVRHGLELR